MLEYNCSHFGVVVRCAFRRETCSLEPFVCSQVCGASLVGRLDSFAHCLCLCRGIVVAPLCGTKVSCRGSSCISLRVHRFHLFHVIVFVSPFLPSLCVYLLVCCTQLHRSLVCPRGAIRRATLVCEFKVSTMMFYGFSLIRLQIGTLTRLFGCRRAQFRCLFSIQTILSV